MLMISEQFNTQKRYSTIRVSIIPIYPITMFVETGVINS